MVHDHGVGDRPTRRELACPYKLVDLICGCQDLHYDCGYIDREHDIVVCDGMPKGVDAS
jgi:hypothetical protein